MPAVTRLMLKSSPMIPPMTFGGAFARTGSRQARQLAWVSARLSVRPVVAMPNRPNSTANQRVEFGWLSAVLICSAMLPVIPASLISSRST